MKAIKFNRLPLRPVLFLLMEFRSFAKTDKEDVIAHEKRERGKSHLEISLKHLKGSISDDKAYNGDLY